MHRAWDDWRKRRMEKLEIEFSGRKKKRSGEKIFFLSIPHLLFFFLPASSSPLGEESGSCQERQRKSWLSSLCPLKLSPSEDVSASLGGGGDEIGRKIVLKRVQRPVRRRGWDGMGWCQRSPVQHKAWNYRRKQFCSQQSWCVGLAGSSYRGSKEYHVFKIKPRGNSTFPKVQSLSADVWSHLAARTLFSLKVGRARRRALPGAHVERLRLRAEQKKIPLNTEQRGPQSSGKCQTQSFKEGGLAVGVQEEECASFNSAPCSRFVS